MARGKRASFGSITRQDKDTWRLRWWADTPTGRRRVSETVHGSRRDAEHRLAEIHVEVGAERGVTVPTVSQCYAKWWLPEAEARVEDGDLAPASLVNFESAWRNHVEPMWGHVPADKVRKDKVAEWYMTMSGGTARVARTVAKQVLDFPFKYDLIPSNPFDFKTRMPKAKAVHSKEVFDLAELLSIARALKGSAIEASFLLSAFGSCRVGESLAVRASEVRAIKEGGVAFAAVHVVRQVSRITGLVDERLKNEWSERTVLVPDRLGERLVELSFDCMCNGLEWLCDDGTGKPLNLQQVSRVWHAACDANGIQRVPYRNLRNSWQTAMRNEVGLPVELIERLMGHVGRGTSELHYDRPSDEQLATAYARAYKSKPFARKWDK